MQRQRNRKRLHGTKRVTIVACKLMVRLFTVLKNNSNFAVDKLPFNLHVSLGGFLHTTLIILFLASDRPSSSHFKLVFLLLFVTPNLLFVVDVDLRNMDQTVRETYFGSFVHSLYKLALVALTILNDMSCLEN